jgi:hypothetical protein
VEVEDAEGSAEGFKLWVLGRLLGAGDLVGGSEAKLLGFCDGRGLGTLLGAGDFIGGTSDLDIM